MFHAQMFLSINFGGGKIDKETEKQDIRAKYHYSSLFDRILGKNIYNINIYI